MILGRCLVFIRIGLIGVPLASSVGGPIWSLIEIRLETEAGVMSLMILAEDGPGISSTVLCTRLVIGVVFGVVFGSSTFDVDIFGSLRLLFAVTFVLGLSGLYFVL